MMSAFVTKNQTDNNKLPSDSLNKLTSDSLNKLPSDSLNKLMLKLQTLQASRLAGRGS